MVDRLIFAAMGAALGAVVAVVLWWLYGLALSSKLVGPGIDPSLVHWIKPASVVFAILGFVFKDNFGSIFGGLLSEIYRAETEEPQIPAGIAVVVLLGAILVILYLIQR